MVQRTCCILCLLFALGCSTTSHSWPGDDRSVVWSAMVAAAHAPEYTADDPRKRWIVVENSVDENSKSGRIQIHRILARSLKLPRQAVQNDRRVWFFDIYLLPVDVENPTAPPKTSFNAKSNTWIPARSIDEADRYFHLVDNLLHQTD